MSLRTIENLNLAADLKEFFEEKEKDDCDEGLDIICTYLALKMYYHEMDDQKLKHMKKLTNQIHEKIKIYLKEAEKIHWSYHQEFEQDKKSDKIKI